MPHTPEQNGVAKRKNRTLIEMARCMLLQSELSKGFWAEAVATANYIRNRCPTTSLKGKTPFELWCQKLPCFTYFRAFGMKAYILNKNPRKEKLDPKAKCGTFIGYSEEAKAYKVWIPSERKVVVSRDVTVLEERLNRSNSDHVKTNNWDNMEIILESDNRENNNEVHRNEGGPNNEEDMSQCRAPGRPRIIRTGKRGRPRKLFRQKSNIIVADHDVDTFSIVQRPSNELVIGCRTVLSNKYKADGSLNKRKARIVAKGYAQRPGIDYMETFAPVARLDSIKLLMALSAKFDMTIEQIDVTSAYLNGSLEEEVYMEKPELLQECLEELISDPSEDKNIKNIAMRLKREGSNQSDGICKLRKAIYGLRQAGRQWHEMLSRKLKSLELLPNVADPCVYHGQRGNQALYMIIYVDDMLIVSSNRKWIKQVKDELQKEFDIKDLGPVQYCLGIEINRDSNKIYLTQRRYILDMLKRYGMENCNSVSTPMDKDVIFSKGSKDAGNKGRPYRELIGGLMYLAIATRPDINHAVSILAQFNDCHEDAHWVAAKRILRYLKGTVDYSLNYQKSDDSIEGHVDADWGRCKIDRRSVTGYVFTLCRGAITWKSQKQRTVALSSTEAEYMALAECAKGAVYLNEFIKELGFHDLTGITIHNDNLGAQLLAKNPIVHPRIKHIDIRYHFIREVLKRGDIRLEHTSTDEMVADALTMPVAVVKHQFCINSMGLK